MAVKWKWKPAAGGSVPADLTQKVNQNETKINTIEGKYVKRDEANTFTAANTFNGQVSINSAGQDFTWETTRTWANNVDNTVVRTGDLKYYKAFETLSTVNINTSWSTGTQWTVNGVNTVGVHEFLICVAISNVLYALNGKVVWKDQLTESKSQFITISDGGAEYMFQIVIKPNNTVALYHKKTGGSNNLQWVRGYIIRGNGLPWKMNQIW